MAVLLHKILLLLLLGLVDQGVGFLPRNGLFHLSKSSKLHGRLSNIDRELNRFNYTGSVTRGTQSPGRSIPMHIEFEAPDYAKDGIPKTVHEIPFIEVQNEVSIGKMIGACRAARSALDLAGRSLRPGMTTDDIDEIVHDELIALGAYPSPLNYQGFPKSVCTSVNEVACHGIPDSYTLKKGDIINIDVTAFKDGMHGDCSETFPVGEIDEKSTALIQTTYDTWVAAMDLCRPGLPYNAIGELIQTQVENLGYKSIQGYCGHGVGRMFHSLPQVHHSRTNIDNGVMRVGHTFTIEPMICKGSGKVVEWPDGWTTTTEDGERSAQFEHTLLMTNYGVVPLTAKIPGQSPLYPWERGRAYAGRGVLPLGFSRSIQKA